MDTRAPPRLSSAIVRASAGCAVGYDRAGNAYKCPCHRSFFGLDGSIREELVAAALKGGSLDTVLFEAPRKDQQAWLIREFGPEVNLANIALDDGLALETLRRGLRSDTYDVNRAVVSP